MISASLVTCKFSQISLISSPAGVTAPDLLVVTSLPFIKVATLIWRHKTGSGQTLQPSCLSSPPSAPQQRENSSSCSAQEKGSSRAGAWILALQIWIFPWHQGWGINYCVPFGAVYALCSIKTLTKLLNGSFPPSLSKSKLDLEKSHMGNQDKSTLLICAHSTAFPVVLRNGTEHWAGV